MVIVEGSTMRLNVIPLRENLTEAQELKAKRAGCLEERERIARELHDTLLQSTQGLILVFQSFAGQLSGSHAMKRKLELALDQASDLLNEARVRIRDLRTSNDLSELARAVRRAAEILSISNPVAFTLDVKGSPRPLKDSIAKHIHSIVQEALANAFIHSKGKIVAAAIDYGSNILQICIRDDGCGIKSDVLRNICERPHFGLQGMRERAHEIGGRLDIRSSHGAGTEVKLAVRSFIVYGNSRSSQHQLSLHRNSEMFHDVGLFPQDRRCLVAGDRSPNHAANP
jgi:signal transduction histidine kinase